MSAKRRIPVCPGGQAGAGRMGRMENPFVRTEMLLGREAMERLHKARVAVFGVGGVGGYVCEALIRSGVGALDLVDDDRVNLSNLNRQILATRKTLGQLKVDAMRSRLLEINPEAEIRTWNCFFLPENADQFPFGDYDYVVDAVDTVTAKLELILRAQACGTPIISTMGAGNKLRPDLLRVADVYQTRICPLARVMRRELKRRGVKRLKVVYSEEEPIRPRQRLVPAPAGEPGPEAGHQPTGRRDIPGSTAFVPAASGLLIAAEIVCDLTAKERS